MKISLAALFLLFITAKAVAQNEKEIISTWGLPVETAHIEQEPVRDTVLSVVDEQAEFPGGRQELMKYLANNIKYPESAVKEKITGKCYIKFVVSKTGEISDAKVIKGIPGCRECDLEALRVIGSMPKWQPAKDKGKAVSSYFNIPITFAM